MRTSSKMPWAHERQRYDQFACLLRIIFDRGS